MDAINGLLHRLQRHPDAAEPLSLPARQPHRHAGRRAAGRRPAGRACAAAAGDLHDAAGRRHGHARRRSSTARCMAARPRRSWCNIPGEAASVVTCIDGHKMARQGRAGRGARHRGDRLVHRRHARRHHHDVLRARDRCGRHPLRAAGELRPDGARPRLHALHDHRLAGEGRADDRARRSSARRSASTWSTAASASPSARSISPPASSCSRS